MEETPYVTRDEVRRLMAQAVDAMTEGICARMGSAPPAQVPALRAETIYDEVARRLQPRLEEAIRKTLIEASLLSGEPHGRRRR